MMVAQQSTKICLNKCQRLTGQWICWDTRCVITCQGSFLYFSCKSLNFPFFLELQQSCLVLQSCQKRLEHAGVLIGFLYGGSRCMNWYECTVLALSLVLCQGIMFRSYLVFSCSLFHLTVTQSRGVTTNGSLYEPSQQGWIYSVIPSSTGPNLKVDLPTFFFPCQNVHFSKLSYGTFVPGRILHYERLPDLYMC